MNQPELKILGFVRAIQKHWLRRQLGWSGLIISTALLVWLLIMILLDNVAMLSTGQLLLGWAILIVGLIIFTGIIIYKLTIGRPKEDRLALMYESRVPNQNNRLINAVQFLFDRTTGSDPMVRALLVENAQLLDPYSASKAVDFKIVRKTLIITGIWAVLLLGYTAFRPSWAGNAFMRLFNPLDPRPHMLDTKPTVTPGNIELVEGQSLTIQASIQPSLTGRLPDSVDLEYCVGKLDWSRMAMTATSQSTFEYLFPAVRHPIRYRVQAGRSISPTYHVNVQERPRIEHLQAIVTGPQYAGGSSRQLEPNVGDIIALTGSTIELSISASVPLARGQVELSEGRTMPLKLDGTDTHRGTVSFKLLRSSSYSINLTDADGLSNVNPPRYTLTAEPDQPPIAIVTQPGRDLILPINARLELALEAADDIGLARVILQTRSKTGEWMDTKQWKIAKENVLHRTIKTSLSLNDFSLNPGDVLLYRVVAYDHRQPEPNMGVGRTWSITATDINEDPSLLADQAKRLLEALKEILALQRTNRTALDMDRAIEPIRQRQEQIRQLTITAIDQERRSLRPTQSVIDELVALADDPMLGALQQLAEYKGTYQQRWPLKTPILEIMDQIIARLETLIGKINKSLASAEKAQKALEQIPPHQREQALKQIRDILEKLREFIAEQDKVIAETEELIRKGEDLTDKDRQQIEKLKGTEDQWAKVFTDSVKDIEKLTEQGFADRSLANDYKEMVEQIEEAGKNLNPELIEMAVPREQAGREMAESLVEEMEMWLPNSPDHIKWMMEEPLDTPEIPMVDLPDQLWDLIGDLIEDQDELNDAAEDMTSAWADSLAEGAGWQVSDGPISNFSAVGKTGNQLPDDHELSGRAGDGRSGRSQGQLVEDIAKGLQGRETPTRITNDPYEQGVVKELQQMATGGATGGGKARGAGQEGLQGQSPPPLFKDLQFMKNWQQRIRQKGQRVAGQLKMVQVSFPELDKSIELMRQAEQAAEDGRYADMFKTQQMVLQNLKMINNLAAHDVALRIERAYHLPSEQRRQVLDAMDEPVPQEYEEAVRRYFQQLSETE